MSKFDDRSKYNDYGSKIGKRNNEAINATNADFRMIVGRRSNGKTYPTLVFDGIKNFIDSTTKRRCKKNDNLFDVHVKLN